jgi:hypothetical protein
MQDTTVIEARLSRAGLDPDQVDAVVADHAADLEGLQCWLDRVHDNDIQEKFGGTDAQAAEADGREGGS